MPDPADPADPPDANLPALEVPLAPRHFSGRRPIVEAVCNRLRQPELLSSQVIGGPRSGKTSLLRWLASPYADDALGRAARCLRIYVDAVALGPQAAPPQFWQLACRELRSTPAAAAMLAAEPALAAELAQVLARSESGELDIFDLQDLFDRCAQLERPVVLLVDEFDAVIANSRFLPPAEFFNQMRNLGNRVPRGLAFVVTAMRPLSDVGAAAAGASPPYNHFGTIALEALSDDDIREQLDALAQRAGVLLPADAWRPVAAASQGHPLLAGHLMRQALDAAAAGRGVDDAARGALAADPDGPFARLAESMLAALTARERQAVAAWVGAPSSVTDSQRLLLGRLRTYALLPPGVTL